MRVDGRVGPVTWKALRQVHLNKLESELMLGTVRDHPAPHPPSPFILPSLAFFRLLLPCITCHHCCGCDRLHYRQCCAQAC